MEYVEGMSLREYLHQHAPLDVVQAARIMYHIAQATAHLHGMGNRLVHRDLKPANILLQKNGDAFVPKIADFGLAIRDDQPQPRGQFAGTTAYMSPEQIDCMSHNLDGRADVWSLGVIFYEMLTGSRPFLGSGAILRRRILEDSPKLPREHRPDIPPVLEELCRKCLCKDREFRTMTAADLAAELDAFLARRKEDTARQDHPLTNSRQPLPQTARPSRRTLLLVALGVVTTLFAASGALIMWLQPRRHLDRVAVPGEWTSLLERGPKTISKNFRPVIVNQTERAGPIYVDSIAKVIVELDETAEADFNLKLVFEKSTWTGDFGLFWGHQEVTYDSRRCRVANAIMVKCLQDDDSNRVVDITCHRWLFIPSATGRYETQDLIAGDPPVREKYYLRNSSLGQIEVCVRGTEVELQWQRRSVVWPAEPAFGDHRGGMGFVNANGAATVGRADFLIPLTKESP